MTKRDEVLRKMIPDTPPEGVECEHQANYKNEPYEVSHKELLEYNDEFSMVNISPIKLAEMRKQVEAGEITVDEQKLALAERFWNGQKAKLRAVEAGEPYRGTPAISTTISSLKECVGQERVEHIQTVGVLKKGGISTEPREIGDLIDFDFLTAED